jgi:hypothetical protein
MYDLLWFPVLENLHSEGVLTIFIMKLIILFNINLDSKWFMWYSKWFIMMTMGPFDLQNESIGQNSTGQYKAEQH